MFATVMLTYYNLGYVIFLPMKKRNKCFWIKKNLQKLYTDFRVLEMFRIGKGLLLLKGFIILHCSEIRSPIGLIYG